MKAPNHLYLCTGRGTGMIVCTVVSAANTCEATTVFLASEDLADYDSFKIELIEALPDGRLPRVVACEGFIE